MNFLGRNKTANRNEAPKRVYQGDNDDLSDLDDGSGDAPNKTQSEFATKKHSYAVPSRTIGSVYKNLSDNKNYM